MSHTITVIIVKQPELYMDLLYAFESGTPYDDCIVEDYAEQRTRDGMTEAVFTLRNIDD